MTPRERFAPCSGLERDDRRRPDPANDARPAIFDPEVVLNPIDEEPSSGFDAMRADMERWASAFDELKVTVEEIIDAGDQVVVVAHHEGRGLPGRSRFR
jgi:hypothetical protein